MRIARTICIVELPSDGEEEIRVLSADKCVGTWLAGDSLDEILAWAERFVRSAWGEDVRIFIERIDDSPEYCVTYIFYVEKDEE